MRRIVPAVLLASAAVIAVAAEPPRTWAPEEVPATLAPAVARGDAAIDELRGRLFARLNELIVQGGPISAIRLCSAEAPVIAGEIGTAQGVDLGRTSFRLRNGANAPRPWAAAFVKAAAGRQPSEVAPLVVDLGDRVGLLRPIVVMPACTRCHGAAAGIDSDVKAELASRYPKDEATGFKPGDLRGFFWAEVKKR
jgi:hypothetical protein